MTPEEWEEIREQISEINPEAILYDGLEDAFIGLCRRFSNEPVALYDYERCIAIRMEDGGSYEEASEFHEFNTMGAWVGEHTPAFLVRLEGQRQNPQFVKELVDTLTDEERYELIHEYCHGCGRKEPGCQCWNDE